MTSGATTPGGGSNENELKNANGAVPATPGGESSGGAKKKKKKKSGGKKKKEKAAAAAGGSGNHSAEQSPVPTVPGTPTTDQPKEPLSISSVIEGICKLPPVCVFYGGLPASLW